MNSELKNFLQTVNDVYGLYRDAVMAFEMLANDTENKLKQLPSNIDLTTLPFAYAENLEEISSGKAKHISTANNYIQRNKVDGVNHIFMANFCIVLIYAYWEYYRNKKIGAEINSMLMGDVKDIRHAIIHNKGVLDKKLKVIKLLQGNEIKINKNLFDEIINQIKKEVSSMDTRKDGTTSNT